MFELVKKKSCDALGDLERDFGAMGRFAGEIARLSIYERHNVSLFLVVMRGAACKPASLLIFRSR